MRRTTPEGIQELKPNQVFVFGTNAAGFHGAGAAGLAFRGDASNTWRTDETFLAAMRAPEGDEARRGRWAVYGIARGLQEGTWGLGYGIQTVTRAGLRRSIPLDEIAAQLASLCSFARDRPDLDFLVSRIGCGLAGYSAPEMAATIAGIDRSVGIPNNVLLPPDLECRLG